MAITKTIAIDGRDVPFRASAMLPRLYRFKFRRDIFRDMQALTNALSERPEGAEPSPDLASLEIFENITYLMAKAADPAIPDDPEAWLDQFSAFSIYQIMPQLFELWGMNVETQAEAKKNRARRIGK